MKNNKGFAPIVIVLIIIAVLALGGVVYYAGKSSTPAPQNTEENNYQPTTEQNGAINTVVKNNQNQIKLSVISPNFGNAWAIGTKQMIKWTPLANVAYVDISLITAADCSQGMLGGACTASQQIATRTPNSGSYSWTILDPTFTTMGDYTNYAISISDVNNSSTTIFSGRFSLKINSNSSDTYIYKNHGFTMELPKGYIPQEEQSEGGPSISITLPNYNHLSYWTDASWWATYNLPGYHFKDEEVIGTTIFKVYYTDSKQLMYWFQQGNVGYEFSGQPQRGDPTDLLKTFHFVGFNLNSETITQTEVVKVYFTRTGDESAECDETGSVIRTIPKTASVGVVTLEELLKGPTAEEKANRYTTNIPSGSKLNSLAIINGEARADFNAIMESGGGSCSMAARTNQIRRTLLQFPTIKTVVLSIDGRTKDIFQP